ncbi:MAG TPA: sugar transferase, partial [Armatimonadetes bacterium]|nr:sugar transferase [Armatimonadota bacterium]
MSLVGPRPLPEEQVDLEDPLQRERLEAVPGLTGLWQTNGRSYLNQEEWLRADLAYVRHRSLRLDLKILLQTFPAVLSGKGAC